MPAETDARLTRSAVAVVLAGGRGTRLGPLTDWRAKPAVPFGGKFRIIDFALSNCVNSGIRRIGICTQYKAQSLIRHVQRGWSFLDGRLNEFVELLPAQQQLDPVWYRGTADAVYQNLAVLRRYAPKFVLVLAGDHVYKMNYATMLAEHSASGSHLTIGCVPVPLAAAADFGVMSIDADRRVVAFTEKPSTPAPMPSDASMALCSMGIYVFNARYLDDLLQQDAADESSMHDFGRDVIPRAIARGDRVVAHDLRRSGVSSASQGAYWRDVGTIDAYWEANMELTKVTPELNLYDEEWPIWTVQEQLPPAKFVFDDDRRRGAALDSLVSGGCIVSGSTIRRSLLFSSVHVHSYCTVEDSVVLSNVDIARGAVLRRAVIDKGCRIPAGLEIGVNAAADRRRFHVSPGGITLVTPEMLGQRVHAPR
ncbi:MAG TPA: glucose-1-phosphate adenylyltransferase [Casimicrobiaceae bacterium]|nr:glucose-1-phosphate adenylyltransferase [Casimicrobiaceae bacterium]